MIPKPVPVKHKVLESHVEAHLRKRMKALGGECYKWSSTNVRGVPDRICIFPGGRIWFVELKRDHKCKLSPLQAKFFERMKSLRVDNCITLHGKIEVDQWLAGRGYL